MTTRTVRAISQLMRDNREQMCPNPNLVRERFGEPWLDRMVGEGGTGEEGRVAGTAAKIGGEGKVLEGSGRGQGCSREWITSNHHATHFPSRYRRWWRARRGGEGCPRGERASSAR